MDFKKAIQLGEKLSHEMDSLKKDLLNKFPVEKYFKFLQKSKKYTPYGITNPAILHLCRRITDFADEDTLGNYHKLILVKLICNAQDLILTKRLPEEIIGYYLTYFNKVISRIEKEGLISNTKYYHYLNDKFVKDIGICRMSLIPAGPVLLDAEWFPISFLFKRGIKQFLKGLLIILKFKGIIPVLKLHTHISNSDIMAEFTPQGWMKFYMVVAELMQLSKRYKGIYAVAWFFDPALIDISPELAYLYEIVLKLNGDIFYVGSNASTVKNATFLSPQRRKLIQEGKYKPVRYAVFFSSRKLINWRKSQLEIESK